MPCFEYNVDPYQPASQKVTDPESTVYHSASKSTILPDTLQHICWKIGINGNILMCSTVQEQITTCGQNAIVKIGERTNIRPQKATFKGGHLMW